MKKIFLMVFVTVLLFSLNAQAHPPTVEIDYLQSEGQLYVYMDHLSRNNRKHFIRKTVISVNGKEVKTESNRQQIDPNGYAFSTSLEAKANDVITVKAYSTEGGVGEASLTVTKTAEGAAPSEVKAKVEDYNNKAQSVGVYEPKDTGKDNMNGKMDKTDKTYK